VPGSYKADWQRTEKTQHPVRLPAEDLLNKYRRAKKGFFWPTS
jgi:hypothetical protein